MPSLPSPAVRVRTERQHLLALYRFQRFLQGIVLARAMPNAAAWLCPPAQKPAWQVLAEDLEASIDALREAYRALLLRDATFRQLVAAQPGTAVPAPAGGAHFYQVLAPRGEELAQPYAARRDAALRLCHTTRQTYAALLRGGPAGEHGEAQPLPAPEQLRLPHTIAYIGLLAPLLKAS